MTDSSSAGAARQRAGRTLRWPLAAPTLIVWATLFAVPVALLILFSFGRIDPSTYKVSFGWTFSNYSKLLEPVYASMLVRSLLIAVASAFICLLVGFPTAYFISRCQGRLQQLLLLAVIIPFWVSFIVRTYAWVSLLRNGGPVEALLRGLHIGSGALDILYTPGSVMVGMVVNYLPLMILPLFVALERVDPSLEFAAADLGTPPRRVLTRVVLPLSVPGVVAGVVLVAIPAAGEYVVPAILGGGKTSMFGNVIFDQFTKTGNYPFGAALAVVFIAFLMLALVLARVAIGSREDVV
ncbi:MAG: ABC transporter permease [Actinobacteria bacterium]|nr:ABC transporter permease [Actinomycetota bacterium]